MVGENLVTEQSCERTHKGLDKQLEVAERRLNAHSETITDLKIIITQLTQLLETTSKTLETMEKRISTLETLHEESSKEAGFWQTPGGQWIIKGFVIIAIIITLAAIGQNVNPEFLASIFGK
ncbi:hypothetical protein [Desulfosporosinus meridiei]|uniref:Uncharacterized protein n=1 Tax=Desulfosporosinus meridiei (strain ATCC BAA-275 / DSM 13257 / KCTC 12902 / NCIMB 13706 / S10) TaxID=768704 RepID=J7J4P6_DESMD|nr:hypothetical protein [Desulfosporosinus meridiei]AFQ46253.1 hypothetical protein Desmer_4447 [Desulfosporosinus meridiei DSM 13257]